MRTVYYKISEQTKMKLCIYMYDKVQVSAINTNKADTGI